jgi:phosphoribosylanthranilate isomerase
MDEISRQAAAARLDVVQLHGDPSLADVRSMRAAFAGEIWAARRLADALPEDLEELAEAADAVLIDSRSAAALGGTGTTFSWEVVAPQLAQLRQHTRFIVAGGLTPDNVHRAIELLQPSVVDVSSGVERAPGVKNETLMRAFAQAVGAAIK